VCSLYYRFALIKAKAVKALQRLRISGKLHAQSNGHVAAEHEISVHAVPPFLYAFSVIVLPIFYAIIHVSRKNSRKPIFGLRLFYIFSYPPR
jgi:hypothetical protein